LARKYFIILIIVNLLSSVNIFAQKKAQIFGTVKDSAGRTLADVNIAVLGTSITGISNDDGTFLLNLIPLENYEIAFSFVGRPSKRIIVKELKAGERFRLDIRMDYGVSLSDAVISEERDREKVSVYTIDPRKSAVLPNISGSFEQILKTLPGVSSNNELSSQYNVRGGNFDENLVYVNDIEIYRPFLPRSGQQEGLSFIHPELVQNVKFSAGGFEAKYGDKMSSVLDVKYKEPKTFKASVSAGLLGVQAHAEDASKNYRFTYLLGARYWSNKYVLGTLDVQGDYQPSFSDVQTLLTYHFTDKLSLSYLGSYAQNRYFFVPENRETVFGTVKQAMLLKIYFDGADLMEYRTTTSAVSLSFKPNIRTSLKLNSSVFYSGENEFFTVEGAYRLSDIETDLGSENFSKAKSLRGIGYFIDNARNQLQATVANISHKGFHSFGKNNLQWGAGFQTEEITDKLNEWHYKDSAGFSQPLLVNGEIVMPEYLNAKLTLSTYRMNAFVQNSQTLIKDYNFFITYGLRTNFWSFNNENDISPRIQASFEPNKKYNRRLASLNSDMEPKKDWLIRAAYGWYYQPPFYRELRDFNGVLNQNIKSPRSIHYVLGADMNFKSWGRPFKFVTEAYFKQMENLVPYEIDNVRIRYYAQNISTAYATGIDIRVNGEFVKGTESWASLSLLNTKEIITNQKDKSGNPITPSYIPRLTDQLVVFAIFFQDYLPNNPSMKMNLNLVYGSGLPFGPPDHNRYTDLNRMPSYRRVDIGFSKQFIEEDDKNREGFWKKHISSAWIGLDVFNMLAVNNVISYLWVDDVQGTKWAVPNYLTGRRLNLKLLVRF